MTKQRHDLDLYTTPRWAVWCLLKEWRPKGRIFCPTVGGGAIVNALKLYAPGFGIYPDFEFVTNDIDPQHEADYHLDATKEETWAKIYAEKPFQSVIENLPFNVAPKILPLVLKYGTHNALFLRNTWIEPCDNRKCIQDHSEDHITSMPRYSFDDQGSDKTACAWFYYDRFAVFERPLTRFYRSDIPEYFNKPSNDRGIRNGLNQALTKNS